MATGGALHDISGALLSTIADFAGDGSISDNCDSSVGVSSGHPSPRPIEHPRGAASPCGAGAGGQQEMRQLQAAASAASNLLLAAEFGLQHPSALLPAGLGHHHQQLQQQQQQEQAMDRIMVMSLMENAAAQRRSSVSSGPSASPPSRGGCLACPQHNGSSLPAAGPPGLSQPQRQQGDPGAAGSPRAGGGEPPLSRELGVPVPSLERLFRADGRHEYEQPVWMVVNLQGKIKGSYTAEKMIEFCRRGTLSARQMVLGIDRDLPYVLRQDLSFYRPLGVLALDVHRGGRYVPLSAARAKGPPEWAPVVPFEDDAAAPAAASGGGGCSGADRRAPRPGGGAAAANAALRVSLQRLFMASGPGARRQPMWLYVNHLGWCRGPFSGGKLMHAHLCGRLPRDTLVVGYDPGVPVFMLSGDVASWFRPLGALLDNVAQGYSYNAVTWAAVVQVNGGGAWQPLLWAAAGPPPPVVQEHQLSAAPGAGAAAGAGAGLLAMSAMAQAKAEAGNGGGGGWAGRAGPAQGAPGRPEAPRRFSGQGAGAGGVGGVGGTQGFVRGPGAMLARPSLTQQGGEQPLALAHQHMQQSLLMQPQQQMQVPQQQQLLQMQLQQQQQLHHLHQAQPQLGPGVVQALIPDLQAPRGGPPGRRLELLPPANAGLEVWGHCGQQAATAHFLPALGPPAAAMGTGAGAGAAGDLGGAGARQFGGDSFWGVQEVAGAHGAHGAHLQASIPYGIAEGVGAGILGGPSASWQGSLLAAGGAAPRGEQQQQQLQLLRLQDLHRRGLVGMGEAPSAWYLSGQQLQ